MTQTIQPDGIRLHRTLTYRHLVKTTLVHALREVYDSTFYEDEFRNMKVTTEFPLDRVNYPSIIVRYDSRSVTASGIGHKEYFADNTGIFREWDSRMFKGGVEFVVVALSPLDRDLLADSLTEILTLGRLDDKLVKFFYTIYGEPTDEVQSFASAIYLNTDQIQDSGESVGPAPWQPEDVLVYQTSLMLDCMGSFYNLVTSEGLDWVWKVTTEPYPQGEQPVSLTYRPDIAWQPAFIYEDIDGFATAVAKISGVEA